MKKNRKRRRLKKSGLIIIIIFLLLILGGVYYIYDKTNEKRIKNNETKLLATIKSHYGIYVVTNKDANLYDSNFKEAGHISKGIALVLADNKITKDTQYFEISNLEGFYIKYDDVDVAEEETKSDRYKVYIPFNQNIKTKDKTTFYNESKALMYTLNKTIDSPIIVKDNDYYGVEFDGGLLYVKKDEVEVYDHHNTDKSNTNGAAVLNYHFFYEDDNQDGCNEVICASASQLRSHLEYFKKNNILTLKMHELEMYMDKKIQLPKSVLITIDDGGRTKVAVDMLTEYKMYATIFLITSWFNLDDYYKTDYIEFHSHTHNMHDGGKCPGGQGGAIKCLPRDEILADLKASREALGGSTAFCYPFYEFNNYSRELLKEAGFTMAFIGEVYNCSYGPYKLAEVGGDKLEIPRFVVVTYTTIDELNRYFNEIR